MDGTGVPKKRADLAVQVGRISEVGVVEGPARRTLEAQGRLVPAGGRRPPLLQGASLGDVATIKTGVTTFENGQDPGARPGRLVRG